MNLKAKTEHIECICFDGVVNVPQLFYAQLKKLMGYQKEIDGDVFPGTQQDVITQLKRLRLHHTFTHSTTQFSFPDTQSILETKILPERVERSLRNIPHIESAISWWISNLPFAVHAPEQKEQRLYCAWLQVKCIESWIENPSLAWTSQCTFYDSWHMPKLPITDHAIKYVNHYKSSELQMPISLIWFALAYHNNIEEFVRRNDALGYVQPQNEEEHKRLEHYYALEQKRKTDRQARILQLQAHIQEFEESAIYSDDEIIKESLVKEKAKAFKAWGKSTVSSIIPRTTLTHTRMPTLLSDIDLERQDSDPIKMYPVQTHPPSLSTLPTTDIKKKKKPKDTPPRSTQFSLEELDIIFGALKKRLKELEDNYAYLSKAFSNNEYLDRISDLLNSFYNMSRAIELVIDPEPLLCHHESNNIMNVDKNDDFPFPVTFPACSHRLEAKYIKGESIHRFHSDVDDDDDDDDESREKRGFSRRKGGGKKGKSAFQLCKKTIVKISWPKSMVDRFIWPSY